MFYLIYFKTGKKPGGQKVHYMKGNVEAARSVQQATTEPEGGGRRNSKRNSVFTSGKLCESKSPLAHQLLNFLLPGSVTPEQ